MTMVMVVMIVLMIKLVKMMMMIVAMLQRYLFAADITMGAAGICLE